MASWKTKEGILIPISEMTITHVRSALKMVIRRWTIKCISTGARYTSGINVDLMTDQEARDTLDMYCSNKKIFIEQVIKGCFVHT